MFVYCLKRSLLKETMFIKTVVIRPINIEDKIRSFIESRDKVCENV